MKAYASKILVLVVALAVIYFFWGDDIQKFLIERGVVDIPSFFIFLYGMVLWSIEKVISLFNYLVEYILQLFNNILSNVNKVLDLFLKLVDLIKKIL